MHKPHKACAYTSLRACFLRTALQLFAFRLSTWPHYKSLRHQHLQRFQTAKNKQKTQKNPTGLLPAGCHPRFAPYCWSGLPCAKAMIHWAICADCASVICGWRGMMVRPHSPTLPSRILRAR